MQRTNSDLSSNNNNNNNNNNNPDSDKRKKLESQQAKRRYFLMQWIYENIEVIYPNDRHSARILFQKTVILHDKIFEKALPLFLKIYHDGNEKISSKIYEDSTQAIAIFALLAAAKLLHIQSPQLDYLDEKFLSDIDYDEYHKELLSQFNFFDVVSPYERFIYMANNNTNNENTFRNLYLALLDTSILEFNTNNMNIDALLKGDLQLTKQLLTAKNSDRLAPDFAIDNKLWNVTEDEEQTVKEFYLKVAFVAKDMFQYV